jgi:hypothetical protein
MVDGGDDFGVPGDRGEVDGVQCDAGKTRECSRSLISSWSGKEEGLAELRVSVSFRSKSNPMIATK